MEGYLIALLIGVTLGVFLHEWLFPEHKTINEINAKFKHNDSVKVDNIQSLNTDLPKRKGFFKRIFSKKHEAPPSPN